ncbi:unnamed protein product [Pleuronectes platessa]|uniref:MADF domain-containing protein n=1 Tax=Pleuronectes platessa TaxID=8262 RepID=A0A9N7V0R5_PLEPL|nr:unnamed protein product [Pleuronectes platessa]
MDQIEKRLAEEIRKYDHLYNTSLTEYKDMQMACNSWKEFSDNVGLQVDECMKLWRKIRDKFGEEEAPAGQSRSSTPTAMTQQCRDRGRGADLLQAPERVTPKCLHLPRVITCSSSSSSSPASSLITACWQGRGFVKEMKRGAALRLGPLLTDEPPTTLFSSASSTRHLQLEGISKGALCPRRAKRA